jgi:pimeloyl-ACP methyl ester carboxylesterase
MDLPGFGLSDKNDVPGTIDFFVETIARFLDALGIEQAYYVGLSMGGQVGLAFAQRYHHRVRRLALVSPAGFETFKPHEAELIKSMTRYAGVLASDPASIRRNMTLNVARWRPAYQWLVTQRRALAKRPDYAAYTAANTRALAGMLDAPVADALGEIQVPVLAFFGTDDKLIPNRYLHPALTPQDVAAGAQAVLPRASVHLVDAAGHLLMIERPDPVNEALRAFLDDGEMARRRNVTRARQSIHINTGPSMGKISVNGTRLHYRISGTGEPLVFVHGLGSSSQDWSRQVDAFADSYRVITFDVRGHGQSDKPEGPYSIPLFAEDTAALLWALEAAPANIVGLSMGGMIALQLALDAPDLVKRLVVVNSTPEAELDSLRDRWIYWSRRLASKVLGMRATGKMIANRIFVKPEQGTLRQQFIERWAANDKQAYLNTIDAIAGWGVADQLGEITCPALIVAADKDYTPVSAKREYAARMPNAELTIIEDSHHATPVERPRAFNHVLDGFLQTTDAAAYPHPPKGA